VITITPVENGMNLRRPFAMEQAVQMTTEHPKRRGKSDRHIADLPTGALAAVIVVLLFVACFSRFVWH
jgi:hypothetical protein